MENINTQIKPSKTIKTLRRYANTIGLKKTSQDGIKIRFDDSYIYYKQSSKAVEFGETIPDWIENEKREIVIPPFKMNEFQLPNKINITLPDGYLVLENHGEFLTDSDIEKMNEYLN